MTPRKSSEAYRVARAQGLMDIAYAEYVLPANEGSCPIDGDACQGHDYADPALIAVVAPVFSDWMNRHIPRRDAEIVASCLASWRNW